MWTKVFKVNHWVNRNPGLDFNHWFSTSFLVLPSSLKSTVHQVRFLDRKVVNPQQRSHTVYSWRYRDRNVVDELHHGLADVIFRTIRSKWEWSKSLWTSMSAEYKLWKHAGAKRQRVVAKVVSAFNSSIQTIINKNSILRWPPDSQVLECKSFDDPYMANSLQADHWQTNGWNLSKI